MAIKHAKLTLLALFLSTLVVPVLAAETVDPGQQITNALKIAFGVAAGQYSDTLLWVRFAIFLLGLVILTVIAQTIPLFKEKKEAAVIVAIIISYIAVRFMPDAAISIIIIFMPIVFVIGIMMMFVQFLRSAQLGFGKEKGLVQYFVIGIAGLVTLYVLSTITTSIAEAMPTVTESAFWPWFTIATFGGMAIIILFLAALTLFGYSGAVRFARGMKDKFRDSKAIQRDLKVELKDIATETKLDAKISKVDTYLEEELVEMKNQLNAGNYTYAQSAVGGLQKGFNTTLEYLKNEKWKAEQAVARAKDAIAKAAAEQRETGTAEGYLETAQERLQVIEAKIVTITNNATLLEAQNEQDLKKFSEEIANKNHLAANILIQKMYGRLQQIKRDTSITQNQFTALKEYLEASVKKTHDDFVEDKRMAILQNIIANNVVPNLNHFKSEASAAKTAIQTANPSGYSTDPRYAEEHAAETKIDAALQLIANAGTQTNLAVVIQDIEAALKEINFALREIEKVQHIPAGGTLRLKYLGKAEHANLQAALKEASLAVKDALIAYRKSKATF